MPGWVFNSNKKNLPLSKRKSHLIVPLHFKALLAFFEILNDKFEYKRWHDFDLHIALEVEESILLDYFKKGKNNNIETRGISNHGFIKSIYFRDPNGYVIELTTPTKNYKNIFKAKPREILNEWTSYKNENFK